MGNTLGIFHFSDESMRNHGDTLILDDKKKQEFTLSLKSWARDHCPNPIPITCHSLLVDTTKSRILPGTQGGLPHRSGG